MKKLGVFLFALFATTIVNSQIIISNDTSFCSPQNIDLYALSAVQSSMQVDDMHDVVVPIGFDFVFYGNTYDKCVVSGNGYITFDTTVAGSGSPWVIGAAIPNPGQQPENAIMAPWQDINTGVSGNIYYGTTGVAPNRMFTVTWCAIAMFSCTSDLHTSQVVMYEGSNKIEMFIEDKPLCITWNGGAAVQGLVDATSTNADIVDDPVLLLPRNWPLTWTATNEGWEFLPNGVTSYTINAITYLPIIAGSATWTDAAGTVLGIGPVLTVNPTNTTTYYCSVTGSCADSTLVDDVTVTITGCLNINLTSEPTDCSGTDGEIHVTPDAGSTAPWLIELQDFNGVNVQVANNVTIPTYIFNNVLTGSYIVKVTEINGGNTDQDTIVVTQMANPLSVTTNFQHVKCYNGSDACISVLPSGGALPYQFFINGLPATSPIPMDSVFCNLDAGTYIMSVIDANNCMDKDTVVITVPDFPLQINPTSKLISCYGELSGTAIVTAIGGTPSYSYEWFDFNYLSIGINDTISGLVAGSYFVKVTDQNGCDTVGSLQVLQVQTPLIGQNQIFGVPCKGDSTGMIVSQATGSQGPYRYYWFDPQGDSILQSGTDQFFYSRDTLRDLPSGTYDLHLYDVNGCSENYTITVGEPSSELTIDNILVSSTITCFGDNTGGAQVNVSGGMLNYYYQWDNGEQTSVSTQLNSGYHTVWVTDDWGCVIEDSVYISENTEIVSTILVDNEVSCYGDTDGQVSVTSIGGSPNYTYFWSNGLTDIGTTSTNSGLIYGSYYLTTQDIYGCEVFDSVLVEQPDPLMIEASEIDSISCYGYDDGLAYAYAGGGTEPYIFYWDSLTGYSGDTNNMMTPGVHMVYVVDSRGCISTDTVLTHQPPVFEVDIIDSILPYCIGVSSASLTSLAYGGTPPFWYEWDDNPVVPQTTPTATNLLAGIYTITVTDSRGCTVSETSDIDIITNTMTDTIYNPVIYNGGYHVSCYGEDDGMLYVIGFGTVHTPFTYQWYGPNGFNSTNDSITNLIAGTYSVTVKDSNNCSVNNSFDITSPDDLQYTTTGVLRNESCEGSCNGQLEISLVGGAPPYVGLSTNTTTGVQLTSTMIGDSVLPYICSGTWSVVLTDDNGCTSSLLPGGVGVQTVGFNDSTNAQIDPIIGHVLCYGTSTGSLSVLNPSTNPNHTYDWENVNTPGTSVGTGDTVINLPAGFYVLLSQYGDSLNVSLPYVGCTTTDTIEITQIDEIDIQETITDVDCYDNNTGSVSTFVSGGTSGYTLQWNPGGQSTSTINNLTEGTYSLSVTDNNGCVKVSTFVVEEPDLLVVNVTQSGATLNSTVIGGVPGYIYRWKEFSNQSATLQGGTSYMVLTPGSYYLEIEDANGCISESDTVTFSDHTSIDGSTSDIGLSIYPNPFSDYTTIDFGRLLVSGELQLIDVLGQVVEVYQLDNQRELIILRKEKTKGIYFVELKVNNKKIFKKIVLQ